ncbi:hypothetical protein J7F01_15095 [Streptomyces sp. ISL-22]|uniref:hypothetical protein n=1 Tax=unclassified Streptomyces TaxID=2593676 RepID=UPI001BEA840F|nr:MULTISPECIES: hypothetical protein [unclassified Streptomyces]MBT2423776.1 hypothetical protein [Streptomyces sp. ISL-24]MBT2433496.1 hypothetical protein [Streptomyces sp. ISL-22]
MLFTDATEATSHERPGTSGVGHRLLGPALPGSVALAVLSGAALFPGTSWWLLAVAAPVRPRPGSAREASRPSSSRSSPTSNSAPTSPPSC